MLKARGVRLSKDVEIEGLAKPFDRTNRLHFQTRPVCRTSTTPETADESHLNTSALTPNSAVTVAPPLYISLSREVVLDAIWLSILHPASASANPSSPTCNVIALLLLPGGTVSVPARALPIISTNKSHYTLKLSASLLSTPIPPVPCSGIFDPSTMSPLSRPLRVHSRASLRLRDLPSLPASSGYTCDEADDTPNRGAV
jgi:hypothetical protein